MRWRYFMPVLLLMMTGCSGETINQFAGGAPSMAPDQWMVGNVDGYGTITSRFGGVKSQFHAHEVGSLDPATHTVTLVEHITYLQGSDRPPTDRTWRFVETSAGQWSGQASDVIGTAKGEQRGNAWHLVYQQKLPIGGRQIVVTVDDWRTREAGGVAIDESAISKFGILLARAEIAFVKSG